VENLEDFRERREEIVAQVVGDGEEEYVLSLRCMEAALEGGAEVERGEYELEDALLEERRCVCRSGRNLISWAAA
jgi:hypothetical protein